MARIVMTIFGSAGDLNPFLAIATGLCARGHEIVFAVEESFRPQGAAAGSSGCVRAPCSPAAAERIERALRHLIESPEVKSWLTSLREAIATEDGVAVACDALEPAVPRTR